MHVQDECANDEYLFDLDHFVQLANEPSSDIDGSKLPAFPAPSQDSADSDLHLVIDARTQGMCSCPKRNPCITGCVSDLLLKVCMHTWLAQDVHALPG